MRGPDDPPDSMFSYVSPEQRVPSDHPLRAIRTLVDGVLRDMSPEFDTLYAAIGRPSIPPERLLRAQLLQIFYSIRSERLLMEQLDYNILFRWFVGMDMDESVWTPTVFTKNRDRLLNQEIARSFFRHVTERAAPLMSDEHFTVDGTLIEAWASQKSFQRKDGGTDGDGRNFHGDTRTNETHGSKTDPDARLYRKSHSAEARLSYLGPCQHVRFGQGYRSQAKEGHENKCQGSDCHHHSPERGRVGRSEKLPHGGKSIRPNAPRLHFLGVAKAQLPGSIDR